jgi:carboxylesterase
MTTKLGALVLHGFTSSLDTVNGLAPHLEAAQIPYRMPYLRGHGKTPDALAGVKYRDWVDDAAAALAELHGEADEVVIVALSMGSLVGMTMAIEQPERLAGLVLVAPYLVAADPLAPFAPLLAPFIKRFPSPKPPSTETYVCTNYTWFPTEAFVQVYRFQQEVGPRLRHMKQPLLILAAENDKVAHGRGPRTIYEQAGSADKRLKWFGKTGHEMMQGCEKDDVFADILAFIKARSGAPEGAATV